MTALVASIPALARTTEWPEIKDQLQVQVLVGDRKEQVTLVTRPTRTGRFFHLLCPRCEGRRRDLYNKGGALGCRTCLKIRHPDQLVPRSQWGREVILPARQIKRIEERLARPGPDRNTRRRLHRRRRRLLQRVEMELTRRQLGMQGQ